MRKTRIGILGGTFNPIHNGHLRAVRIVQRKFSLDRVLLVPSFLPPHKTAEGIAPASDRLAMVELAVRRHPRLAASAIEIEAGGRSYSIDTLNKVKKIYPGARIFFILGVDAFVEIQTWHEWKRVLEQCLFIVVSRPGYRLSEAVKAVGREYLDRFRSVARAGRIQERWFSRQRIFVLPIDAANVSSSEIRLRVRENRSIKGWVPADVERYILRKRLYKRPSSVRDARRGLSGPESSNRGRGEGGLSKSRHTWNQNKSKR